MLFDIDRILTIFQCPDLLGRKESVYEWQKKSYTYVQFADTGRFLGAKCDEPCFYVLRSPDMINWTEPKICFRKGDFWADGDYWAPECHAMLFTSFEGKLMMSLHCPNIHPKKRILLFEMEELGDRLAIRNEITGNWYNSAGGTATDWRYKVPCTEEI